MSSDNSKGDLRLNRGVKWGISTCGESYGQSLAVGFGSRPVRQLYRNVYSNTPTIINTQRTRQRPSNGVSVSHRQFLLLALSLVAIGILFTPQILTQNVQPIQSSPTHIKPPPPTRVTSTDDDEDEFDFGDPGKMDGPKPDTYRPNLWISEGVDSSSEQAPGIETPQPIPNIPPTVPYGNPWDWALHNLQTEFFSLAALVVVIILAVVGCRTNRELAESWIKIVLPTFREQFSTCGSEPSVMIARSFSYYCFYATGRVHCKYLNAYIECIPRQCIWRRLLFSLIFRQKDTMSIEVPMTLMDKAVVCICKKRDVKNTQQSFYDVQQFCKTRTRSDVPSTMVAMSDSIDSLDQLLQPSVLKALQMYEPYIQSIYASDIGSVLLPTGYHNDSARLSVLRVTVALPSLKDDSGTLNNLVRLSLHLIDIVASISISEKTRSAVVKVRQAYEKEILKGRKEERQEIMERKRQEKKKHEEDKFQRMTPEQQRKFEEKQHRKQVKSNKPEMKMVRV